MTREKKIAYEEDGTGDDNISSWKGVASLNEVRNCSNLGLTPEKRIIFPKGSRVLVDMDGVLADFNKSLLRLWANHPVVVEDNWFPLYPPEGPTMKIPPVLRARWGDGAVRVFRSVLNSGSFYENLPPIPGAVEGFQSLIAAGYDVSICTRPSNHVPTCADEKIAWALKHFGSDIASTTTVIRDKTLVDGDYLIDDKSKVTGSKEASWFHVVYAAPHNTSDISWANLTHGKNFNN